MKPTKAISPALKITGEFLGLVIAYLSLTYIFPRLPFTIKQDYLIWYPFGLWSAIISAVFKTIGHLIGKRFNHLFQAFALMASFYGTHKFNQIFPFDFSLVNLSILNTLLKITLFIALFGVFVTIITQLNKFRTWKLPATQNK